MESGRWSKGGGTSLDIGSEFMRLLMTALVLLWAGSSSAQTFDPPAATPDVTAAAVRPKSVFNKKIFWIEAGAYTLFNVLDGATTVAQTPGYEESAFPQGSSFLLGKHPSAGRYVATFGVLQIATSIAAYRLEHCPNRWLRMVGHGLMIQGTFGHADGYISNVLLRNSVSGVPQTKLARPLPRR
jgi:hypothetical protein